MITADSPQVYTAWKRATTQTLHILDTWLPSLRTTLGSMALARGDLPVVHHLLLARQAQAPDLVVQFVGPPADPHSTLLVYLDGMVDASRLTTSLVTQPQSVAGVLRHSGAAIRKTGDWAGVIRAYLIGQVVVLRAGHTQALLVDLSEPPHRAVSQPDTEHSIRGPQEAFLEVGDLQVSQLRHRLPSADLTVEAVTVGSRIPTVCRIVYLAGLAAPTVVETVRQRLQGLSVDAATNATRVGSLIRDHSWAFFPTVRYTERVDLAAFQIEQGKVAILVSGDPAVITVPATLSDFYRTSADYSAAWYDASFIRIIRGLAWGFGLFLPALYIALTEVNPDLISPTLFDLVAGSHTGLPFTPLVEVVVMILVIEILREAALRLPKVLGSTIGTVGAIVVGTAVVKAGFVSPQIIVLMTLTALSLFSVPTYELLASWRLMSWMMLGAGFVLGVYGIVLLTLWLSVVLIGLSSFGTPYLTPIAPWRPKDWDNLFIRAPWTTLRRRLTESQTQDLKWWDRS